MRRPQEPGNSLLTPQGHSEHTETGGTGAMWRPSKHKKYPCCSASGELQRTGTSSPRQKNFTTQKATSAAGAALCLGAVFLCFVASASAVDGVFDESPAGGAPLFQAAGTTEEASVTSQAVPEPEGAAVPGVGYYRHVADWFLSWLKQNGVDTSAVEITISDDTSHSPWKRPHLKLHAARALAKDEVLFRLPPSVQVSTHAVLYDYSPYQDPAEHEASGWLGYTTIASWILRERAVETSSQWAAYLRLLPPYVSLPIFFPDELVFELQFEPLINTVQAYRQAIQAEYKACRPDALQNATLEEFFWAISMGMSRAFDGPTDPARGNNGGATVLLPLADLMDHSNHYNVLHHVEADGSFVFSVSRDVPAGEELWNQYGLKNTDFLLLSYGFVLDPNEQDSIRLADRKGGARDIYRAYYVTEQNPFGDAEDSWAMYLSEKADAATVEVARKEREVMPDLFGPKYDLGYEDALNAWHGGLVDPPLLAALASSVYYFSFGKEPDYEKLAHVSVWYGWYIYSASCAELAKHVPLTDDELQSFISAATGIRSLVDGMLQQLPTTVAEDENILRAITVCQAGGDPVEQDSDMKTYCESLSAGDISIDERELVVRARLAKKRILLDLSARIEKSCTPGMTMALPPPSVGSDIESGDSSQSQSDLQSQSQPEWQSQSESLPESETESGQDHQRLEGQELEASASDDDTSAPTEPQAQPATGKKTVQDGEGMKIEISTAPPQESQGGGSKKPKKSGWWN